MKCWKCKEEMICEYQNPWRKNKYSDKICSGTFICWDCQTIIFVKMTEVNHDIRDDDLSTEIREGRTEVA